MPSQGKSNKSPTKSALKKAKRAAARARQDLAWVFDTESDKDTNTPDLDDIDVVPVRIPKKSDVDPAYCLAPPAPTMQDIQTESIKLRENVVIPD